MAVRPEGTPCWADALFADPEAAKGFYGEVLGWTFGESSAEFGNYTQAYVDGGAVAGLAPRMPGMEGPSSWNLYFATPDAGETAARIRAGGGSLAMDPMPVGDFGTMVTAQDPTGLFFSAWQAGSHEGFGKTGVPGAYTWADVYTREPERTDPFFLSVFPLRAERMEVDEVDFQVWKAGDDPVAGRLRMTGEFPPDVPPYINVYFAVPDVDDSITAIGKLGGRKVYGPMDSPFGRFATVQDPQGAVFSVIDTETRVGEMPAFS